MEIRDLNSAECWSFLGERRIGRLGCCLEGKPYVVPVNFAIVRPHLFAFTTEGKKVDYLRGNSSACIQFDEIKSRQDWISVVADGRFEELTEIAEQDRAHALLETAAWWEPGYVRTTVQGQLRPAKGMYFRISVEAINGRRGIPGS